MIGQVMPNMESCGKGEDGQMHRIAKKNTGKETFGKDEQLQRKPSWWILSSLNNIANHHRLWRPQQEWKVGSPTSRPPFTASPVVVGLKGTTSLSWV